MESDMPIWIAARWNVMRTDRLAVTALEYGLIASLVAVVIIAAVRVLGTNLSTTFQKVATSI